MSLFASVVQRLASGVVLFFAVWGLAYADGPDGTWQLVMRKLPDGTVQTPPTVQGRFTVKNGVTQLIVFWPTPEGRPASLSELSRWEWSEHEVAATPLLVIFDDGSGKPALYAVGGETKRTPVTRQGARMSYQHPIDAPFIVWEGDKLTATLDGAFIDYWEKVK
jgi:hypothetical protein